MRNGNIDADLRRQRGFTLVELMIAVVIALFLMGGLLTLVGAMKRTTSVEGSLDQLHDNERMAMSIITDVLQSTGYFPMAWTVGANPTVIGTVTAAFPAVTTAAPAPAYAWPAGQIIYGTQAGAANAPNDTISLRYNTAGTTGSLGPPFVAKDGIINCGGATSTVAATWINTFSLNSSGTLQCVVTSVVGGVATNATAVPLVTGFNKSGANVSGVQYMRVYYGVQSNTSTGLSSVDSYLTANQMTAANWASVISVQIILYFSNPLYGQPGQTVATKQYLQVSRVIGLMNTAGAI